MDIYEAIKKAKEAAAVIKAENLPQPVAQSTQGVPGTPTGQEVATLGKTVAQSLVMDLQSFIASNGIQVDGWLKVTRYGDMSHDNKTMFKEAVGVIDMSEVKFCMAVRYGNPPNYHRTYDGVITTRGRPWTEVLMEAANYSERPYKSADIPVLLLQIEGLPENFEAIGKVYGISLSPTNRVPFQKFCEDVKKKELENKKVLVRVYSTVRTNPGKPNSGIFNFELLGEYQEQ